MYQNLYISIILISAIGGFLYFRKRDQDFRKRDSVLMLLGAFFLMIGSIATYFSQGKNTLIKYLLLEDVHVGGKLILIGYIFLLLGFFFFIERIINKLLDKKNRRKRGQA